MDNLFFDLKRLKYLGAGAIVGRAVRIRQPERVSIGDHTIIDDFTYISAALETGRYCHIASQVCISGGRGALRLGHFVGIAAGSTLHTASSDYLGASFDLPSIPAEFQFGGVCEDLVFEDHVLLGAQTVVLPGVHLPEGFACAAHTVIRKRDYMPWTLYGGYECQRLYRRPAESVKAQAARLLAASPKPSSPP
jgi:galactoside O-acetyltransferase